MVNIEDYPGFATFCADIKATQKAKCLSRKTMAEIMRDASAQKQRVSHKPKLL